MSECYGQMSKACRSQYATIFFASTKGCRVVASLVTISTSRSFVSSGIGWSPPRSRVTDLFERAGLGNPWHTRAVAHSTKQILQQLLDELPDDATIAEVQYRLYVIDAVNRGRDEIASGAGIPHEQVAAELRAKWGRARVP